MFKEIDLDYTPYKPAYIYLMNLHMNNWYKLGRSINVKARLSTLTGSNPNISLVHAVWTTDSVVAEAKLLDFNKHAKIKGEVFKLTNAELENTINYMETFAVNKSPNKSKSTKSKVLILDITDNLCTRIDMRANKDRVPIIDVITKALEQYLEL